MSEFSMAELRDMAPAYVLGALNDEELVAFERALASSHELTQEVNAYRNVVAQVGSAHEVSPPPVIRARFLDKISTQKARADEQSSAPPTTIPSPVAPPATADPEKRPFTVSTGGAPASKKEIPYTPQRGNSWLTAVIAVGMAASLVFAIQRNSQVSSLNTQLAQRDSILAERTTLLAARDSTLNTIFEAERNLVLVNLVAAPTSGPSIQFFWNLKQGRAVMRTAGLTPAEAGKIYQLWFIKDGKPVPSRIFNTGADNKSLESGIEMPTTMTGVTAVAITIEPAGGSQQPTTTPFLVGEIPKAAQQ